MNFSKIESLVLLSKTGNEKAKEELVEDFKPFILNLCKKSYVNGFEFEDLKNECYQTLFKCVRVYDLSKHRFVAYATNAIKNSINNLIRISKRRDNREGPKTLILDNNLDHVLSYDMDFVENEIYKASLNKTLKAVLKNLTRDELELIKFVYFEKHSLKQYSHRKGISYITAITRRNNMLKKLKNGLLKEDYII
ncbi:sigma-70 family RNA polymerase sigma factor [Clostridium sp. UBA4548]|uniref:sigma-70 family RNA polymerase sigma factor n=1 Tax=Clostridium sp. UBA4548 TaxID=1946361 RepID=UPI0025C56B04|nr:sigma-70 family RNA polymerase sigma factor [Clostridium sp. UBA4548]